jgi:hypothetical protein
MLKTAVLKATPFFGARIDLMKLSSFDNREPPNFSLVAARKENQSCVLRQREDQRRRETMEDSHKAVIPGSRV